MITAIGLSIVLQNGMLEIFSADVRRLDTGALATQSWSLGSQVSIGVLPLITALCAVAVIVGLLGVIVVLRSAGLLATDSTERMRVFSWLGMAFSGANVLGPVTAGFLIDLGGFAAAKALGTAFNDNPEQASRPFDAQRDGFVMGEGAGMLVIEALDHALARGAQPLAELVGYGTSADAYHITSGPEDGDGAARSMLAALAQAGLTAQDVQHLNAHATSTGVGDRGELAAIRRVFGAGSQVAISSTKSATGHLLGAAGAVATIFTTLALRDQVVPGALNLHTPDALAEGLDLVALRPRPMALSHAMLNGFGFGGVNATLVLRRWPVAA